MKKFLSISLYLFTASCSHTDIEDQTQSETPADNPQGYSVNVKTHTHGISAVDPVVIMCENIKQGMDNIEGYHPIYVVEAFPSKNGSALRFGYNPNIPPKQNLINRLNSGRVYGYQFRNQSPRESYVYRMCMPNYQKALVDAYLDTMTACQTWNFGIYTENRRGGSTVTGDNNRACGILGRELIDIHQQGYKPSILGKMAETGTMLTGGLFKTGDSGAMLKALTNCTNAGKELQMNYEAKEDELSFSCTDTAQTKTSLATSNTSPSTNNGSPISFNISKEEFHRQANVLRPEEFGKRREYGRIVEYQDTAGDTRDKRARSFDQHLKDITARGFSCTKKYRLRSNYMDKLKKSNSISFPMEDKWNYISIMCEGNCDNLYYSVLSGRPSYFTYKGHRPFPNLLAIGTQTLTMTQTIGLRFGVLDNGELKNVPPDAKISVIHWEKTLSGALFGDSCNMKY